MGLDGVVPRGEKERERDALLCLRKAPLDLIRHSQRGSPTRGAPVVEGWKPGKRASRSAEEKDEQTRSSIPEGKRCLVFSTPKDSVLAITKKKGRHVCKEGNCLNIF